MLELNKNKKPNWEDEHENYLLSLLLKAVEALIYLTLFYFIELLLNR